MLSLLTADITEKLASPAIKAFAIAVVTGLLIFGIFHAGTLAQKGLTERARVRAENAEKVARQNAEAVMVAKAESQRLAKVGDELTAAREREQTKFQERLAEVEAAQDPENAVTPPSIAAALEALVPRPPRRPR